MLGLSVVAGDNDHFRRQLPVLELVRAGQAVAAAHIDHLVTSQGLPSSLSVSLD